MDGQTDCFYHLYSKPKSSLSYLKGTCQNMEAEIRQKRTGIHQETLTGHTYYLKMKCYLLHGPSPGTDRLGV